MKLFALLVLGLLLPAGMAFADQDLEAEPKTYTLEGVREMSLDFPVGELKVEGDDGKNVRVSIRVHCKSGSLESCQEHARKVTIDRRQVGTTLKLRIENGSDKLNTRGMSIEARLLVPRALATHVKMGVGALTVSGHGGDLDVDLGVGDLRINAAEKDYRAVRGEVGVGDVSIRTRSGRTEGSGFIGHSADWDSGKGPSKTTAHVGVGSMTVVLD
jgi:hypothetical protein